MRTNLVVLSLIVTLLATVPCAAQPLRGTVQQRSFVGPVTGRTVQFNIYLPEGYASSTARYPVIYHLHGIGGSQGGPQNQTVPASFEAALAQGLIGPVIIVFPNGYTDSFWADSFDGAKPAETDVVQQLIPHVDANFRTIPQREARIIEGFSMGGFGATKFYAKFPELFIACVEYDGAMVTWDVVQQFHPQQAAAIFGGSEAYFDQFSPWHWSEANAAVLSQGSDIRMAVALVGGNRNFRDHLIGLGIPVDYVETGCAHEIPCLFTAQGAASAAFIAAAIEIPCAADFNHSGGISTQDIFDFLAAFFANDARADVNNSGAVTTQDVFDFLRSYFTGCPG